MADIVLQTEITDFPVRRGKVRDIYDLGDNLLIVASDRISAFDCILPTGIPYKGKVLTQLSVFWFNLLADITDSHIIAAPDAASEITRIDPALAKHAEALAGRTMLVRKAEVLPVECVVRGYLAGSGWKSYQTSQEVCGIKLPEGLSQASRLPESIFTPATKAESGHDENISFEEMCDVIGVEMATQARDRSVALYEKARDYALERQAFGRPIAHHQALAFLITDMYMAVEGSRFLLHEAAWRLDAGIAGTMESAQAFAEAIDASRFVGPNGVQILGGHGFMRDYPVEKYMRESRALGLLLGGVDAAREEAGRILIETGAPVIFAPGEVA
jgi:phosphoribosylaminoimidazole-succinocarboxamide synthase